jgi:hypothetical protein
LKSQNKTKLTLSCNLSIIEEAKEFVSLENESLSSIVENFLATYIAIKKNKKNGEYKFHVPEIEKLSGSFNLGNHKNYKKEYKAS